MNDLNTRLTDIQRHAAQPLLVIISGPSGVGKDAVLSRMKQQPCPYEFVVTATTRTRRSSEQDHVDYHFMCDDDFRATLQKNGFLESARVYDCWYGVPREAVRKALATGKDTIIKVDVQGAATIKSLVPEALFIFILPSSVEELQQRLSGRGTESTSSLDLRLKTVAAEMERINLFDYAVINAAGQLDETIDRIRMIIAAEKCRVNPRKIVV